MKMPSPQSAYQRSRDRTICRLDSHRCNCFARAGAKYSQYCAIVSRTYLIDPNKQQEQEYAALAAAMDAVVKALKPGAPCSDAYAAAVKALQVRCMHP